MLKTLFLTNLKYVETFKIILYLLKWYTINYIIFFFYSLVIKTKWSTLIYFKYFQEILKDILNTSTELLCRY